MHDRHTGKYLFDLLDTCIRGYGISWDNISSLTTDNGSNMRTLLSSINSAIENVPDASAESENSHSERSDNISSNILSNMEDQQFYDSAISDILNKIEVSDHSEISMLMSRLLPNESEWSFANITNDVDLPPTSFLLVNGVICAAHTLQLVVKDSLANLGQQHE